MSLPSYEALNFIKTPVWLVSSISEQVIFANPAATALMLNKTLTDMRTGVFSANAQHQLSMYVPDLKSELDIIEVWTIWRGQQETTLAVGRPSLMTKTLVT